MNVVLDTNVLVSGLLKASGNPAKIVNLIVRREVILFLDSRIFLEYKEVLKRDKFMFNPEKISVLLDYFKKIARFISPVPLNVRLADPYDLPFYEVAKASDSYLITGNIEHFPKNDDKIFLPKNFIEFYKLRKMKMSDSKKPKK